MTQPPRKFDPAARRPPTIPYAGGSGPMPAAAPNAPPPPPPPPRPLTPVANRRSWTEPLVRFWILATAALVGIAGWFVTEQLLAARREAWLIKNGTPTEAVITEANGDSRPGRWFPPDMPCTLKFDWQNETLNVHGTLNSSYILAHGVTVGHKVQIRVDPNDPTDWTDREQPEPLARRLIAGAVIVLAALVTALAALLLHWRVVRVWREGQAFLYTVVDTRYSALAPLSPAARCVDNTGRDSTIITVHLPMRLPRPQPGEVLWLIHPEGKPTAAIAASAFE